MNTVASSVKLLAEVNARNDARPEEKKAWAIVDALESEIETEILERASVFAPYIMQMIPGQAVQVFGSNRYNEVCKVFGVIHRDQKISTKLGVLSINIAVASWQSEHHECVGYEDCGINRILMARDDVIELGIEEIFSIRIVKNKGGAFYQIRLDRDFEA